MLTCVLAYGSLLNPVSLRSTLSYARFERLVSARIMK